MPLFKKLKIITVWHQAILENRKLMYKLNIDMCPPSIGNMYDRVHAKYNTRGLGIAIHAHKTKKYNDSSFCRPFIDWKSLPQTVKMKPSVKSFVNQIEKDMLAKY